MAEALTDDQIAAYNRDGVLFPLPVFPPDEVAANRARFDALLAREGGRISRVTNTRSHLILKWVDEIIRDARVLDPVESLLGPDILCWGSGFFAKQPNDGTFISWHQDATYWGLSSNDVVSAWIALSPSNARSGCMRVVPGTHAKQMAHRDTFDPANLLSRGQEIAVDVNEADAVDVVLAPGQMSLHHVLIHHGSERNRGEEARIGLVVRYIPARLRQLSPMRDTAMLVRGQDRHGHFDLEPRPSADFAPEAVAWHRQAQERLNTMTGVPGGRPG